MPDNNDKLIESVVTYAAWVEVKAVVAKAKAESPRTYTERLQDMGRLPKPTGGGGGDFSGMKGLDKPFKNGGKVSSASSRADGIAMRGKTKGRMV